MIAKSLPLLVPHHSNGLLDSRVCRTERDYLYIDVSYTSVYPLERPGAPADWMRLVVNEYGDFAFPVAVPA